MKFVVEENNGQYPGWPGKFVVVPNTNFGKRPLGHYGTRSEADAAAHAEGLKWADRTARLASAPAAMPIESQVFKSYYVEYRTSPQAGGYITGQSFATRAQAEAFCNLKGLDPAIIREDSTVVGDLQTGTIN